MGWTREGCFEKGCHVWLKTCSHQTLTFLFTAPTDGRLSARYFVIVASDFRNDGNDGNPWLPADGISHPLIRATCLAALVDPLFFISLD